MIWSDTTRINDLEHHINMTKKYIVYVFGKVGDS